MCDICGIECTSRMYWYPRNAVCGCTNTISKHKDSDKNFTEKIPRQIVVFGHESTSHQTISSTFCEPNKMNRKFCEWPCHSLRRVCVFSTVGFSVDWRGHARASWKLCTLVMHHLMCQRKKRQTSLILVGKLLILAAINSNLACKERELKSLQKKFQTTRVNDFRFSTN